MIGYLKGILGEKKPNSLILDVNGVGYLVNIPVSTFLELPDEGSTLALFIYTHVREETLALYGFRTMREKVLFEKLISVSGIGPKVAISFLSGMSADELIPAIQNQDIGKLSTIPGVGRKTAERVSLELREKIPQLLSESAQAPQEKPMREDLISALVNLGYQQSLAERIIKNVLDKSKSDASFEELLKNALHGISG
ncbi:Holliday junction branch migration protein RuvA [bacterium]|nr:Holliday junction branch migration protein RuvA [bacterium]MCI0614598.1 Holliday junction branch migration protein RuvA [bacterium]